MARERNPYDQPASTFRPKARKRSKKPTPIMKAIAKVTNLSEENKKLKRALYNADRKLRGDPMRIFDPAKLERRKAEVMSTDTKEIAAVYRFKSESSPDKPPYETLLYTDGTTSCNCKGWTFAKKSAAGARTCRHTRQIDTGMAQRHADSFNVYQQVTPKTLQTRPPLTTNTGTTGQGELNPRTDRRRFNFD